METERRPRVQCRALVRPTVSGYIIHHERGARLRRIRAWPLWRKERERVTGLFQAHFQGFPEDIMYCKFSQAGQADGHRLQAEA